MHLTRWRAASAQSLNVGVLSSRKSALPPSLDLRIAAAIALNAHLTATDKKLMRDAEHTAAELETDAASRLSASEKNSLIRLLQKVYL